MHTDVHIHAYWSVYVYVYTHSHAGSAFRLVVRSNNGRHHVWRLPGILGARGGRIAGVLRCVKSLRIIVLTIISIGYIGFESHGSNRWRLLSPGTVGPSLTNSCLQISRTAANKMVKYGINSLGDTYVAFELVSLCWIIDAPHSKMNANPVFFMHDNNDFILRK